MPDLFSLLILVVIGLILLELIHFFRPSSPLELKPHNWQIFKKENEILIIGSIQIYNPHSKMEVMVPELKINPLILSKNSTDGIKIDVKVQSNHPEETGRDDNYWFAYIVKSNKNTYANVKVSLTNPPSENKIKAIENIWIDINWINYGPFGLLKRRQGFVVPIQYPDLINENNTTFRKASRFKLLPIKTHLLGSLDKTVDILSHYAGHIIQPGDILTIGETPVAIMQGRYIHPSNIKNSFIANLLCRSFHPTSSLATACGMQTLINLVGPSRVIIAWFGGVLLKFLRIKGGFYQLAGDQARLIDDITGTTPPYDQTIVLGPLWTEKLCKEASSLLGISVAIVDVNDLGNVKILASSRNCNDDLVRSALQSNPAGNANEQTPLVLIRPS